MRMRTRALFAFLRRAACVLAHPYILVRRSRSRAPRSPFGAARAAVACHLD
jgi:hypothetical protein